MIPKDWLPEDNVPIRLSPEELSLCYQGRFDSFFDPNNHAFTPRHERRSPVCDRKPGRRVPLSNGLVVEVRCAAEAARQQ